MFELWQSNCSQKNTPHHFSRVTLKSGAPLWSFIIWPAINSMVTRSVFIKLPTPWCWTFTQTSHDDEFWMWNPEESSLPSVKWLFVTDKKWKKIVVKFFVGSRIEWLGRDVKDVEATLRPKRELQWSPHQSRCVSSNRHPFPARLLTRTSKICHVSLDRIWLKILKVW